LPLPALFPAVLPLAVAAATPVGMPVGEGADALDGATARMVGAIVDYARWPQEPQTLNLCITANPRHAGAFPSISPSRDIGVQVRAVNSGMQDLSQGCHVLYIGPASLAEMRRITASARGSAVVTIAEADPSCRSEAMFCLLPGRGTLSFRLNVDAVSRSQVRIDPRVLRMSRGN